jgi:hypothetical protein
MKLLVPHVLNAQFKMQYLKLFLNETKSIFETYANFVHGQSIFVNVNNNNTHRPM